MPHSWFRSKIIEKKLFYLPLLVCFSCAPFGSPDPDPVPCVEARPDTGEKPHWGNYDYQSCNTQLCHANWVGGWVYNNPTGDEIVQGATVTVTSSDGTTLEAITRSDGFFVLLSDNTFSGNIIPPFTPCVSKCPSTECAQTAHTSTDCQSSNCHGRADAHLYLPQKSSAADLPCENLPSGGPRVHDTTFDSSCRMCHDSSYIGGFVYDGITSDTPVDRATLTLTPKSGAAVTAVTGSGGMFQFLDVINAPYIACVSKCEVSVCSSPGSHSTVDDCGICHDPTNRIHLP
ncbi:MAG: carboxypeptidase regulatory-like domain-containing protein [Deltaproteobacteria bacterium]|nr:carboxypeptidase regulatory-like domain-containing protein [Deltaproteobacteria bacterium]